MLQAWKKGLEANHEVEEIERYVQSPGKLIKIKHGYSWYSGEEYWDELKNGHMSFSQRATL